MIKKLCILSMVLLAAFAAGCSKTNETVSANTANANTSGEITSTKPGPDNSEITTSLDASGVKTETRIFHDNPRVAKVVVTTHSGNIRTVKVYHPNGEERELNKDDSEGVLEATGSKIADAAGFVAAKTEDVAGAVKDKSVTAGDKTVEGTKKVGEKTAEGAKKAGNAIKKVVP